MILPKTLSVLCLVALFLWLPLSSCAQSVSPDGQSDSLLTYVARIARSSQTLAQEKVYLHFDNTGYFLGERMWFKAYVVRAGDGRPTDMSRVLYVELVSPGGDVVKKRTLRIDSLGQACGDIGLDSIYGSGFYEVRAYTRYMTNWGSAAAFSRVFPIFRAPSAAGDYAPVMDERDYRHRLPDSQELAGQYLFFYETSGGKNLDRELSLLSDELRDSLAPKGREVLLGVDDTVASLHLPHDFLPAQPIDL